jgi:hypothetical protein
VVKLVLGPVPSPISGSDYSPVLRNLALVAATGCDLLPAILTAVQAHGFDSFSYRAGLQRSSGGARELFELSTIESGWWLDYDQNGYVEVDPRVTALAESSVPLVWEQNTFRGRSAATDIFLDVALKNGIASGVAIPIHESGQFLGMATFDSSIRISDSIRSKAILNALGEIALFLKYFHYIVSRAAARNGIDPASRGRPISQQEKRCLDCLAIGHPMDVVAERLDLPQAVVCSHVFSVLAKLNARSLEVAIVIGQRHGMIGTSRSEEDSRKLQ